MSEEQNMPFNYSEVKVGETPMTNQEILAARMRRDAYRAPIDSTKINIEHSTKALPKQKIQTNPYTAPKGSAVEGGVLGNMDIPKANFTGSPGAGRKIRNQTIADISEETATGADKSNNLLKSNAAIDYLKEDYRALKKAGLSTADKISGSKKLAEETRAASMASGANDVENVVEAAKSERTMGKIGGELLHDLGRGSKVAGGAKLGAYMAGTAVLANMLNPFGD